MSENKSARKQRALEARNFEGVCTEQIRWFAGHKPLKGGLVCQPSEAAPGSNGTDASPGSALMDKSKQGKSQLSRVSLYIPARPWRTSKTPGWQRAPVHGQ